MSKEEIERRLQTKPIKEVAKECGVCHTTLRRRIDEYGIVVPNINWNRINGSKRWNKREQAAIV
jgi:hypothetical protein